MSKEESRISHEFTQPLMDHWNAVLSKSELIHDLGQTPEWCRRWAEAYRAAYDRLVIISMEDAVYPLMIRRIAGLRVIMWIGQEAGMTSDYSGGAGSYEALFDCLRELDGWDVACLQLPYWQRETREIVKAVCRYEKYIWKVEVAKETVVIDLPETHEEWLKQMSPPSRKQARRNIRFFDQSDASFEILRGDILSGIDGLIENNARNWEVFSAEQDIAFMKKTAGDLKGNNNFFLARLYDDDSTWAATLGYRSGDRVFFHAAGVRRERIQGMSPGTTMDARLVRQMIDEKVRHVDMCPGLEGYKFSLGGYWMPNHRIVFARNRLYYCWWQVFCSVCTFLRAIRLLIRRKVRISGFLKNASTKTA